MNKNPIKVLVVVGIIVFIIGFMSLQNNPDAFYATGSYGTGVVRYHNTFGHVLCWIGGMLAVIGFVNSRK